MKPRVDKVASCCKKSSTFGPVRFSARCPRRSAKFRNLCPRHSKAALEHGYNGVQASKVAYG
eukprot:2950024-Amphidinium_carterae.1